MDLSRRAELLVEVNGEASALQEPIVRVLAATLREPKHASRAMRVLAESLPTAASGLSHLKRIKRGPSGLAVVLATSEMWNSLPKTVTDGWKYEFELSDPFEVDVPRCPPTTRQDVSAVSVLCVAHLCSLRLTFELSVPTPQLYSCSPPVSSSIPATLSGP